MRGAGSQLRDSCSRSRVFFFQDPSFHGSSNRKLILVSPLLVVRLRRPAGSHSAKPFGQVPAFEDGELVLFESRAIARYVLHKHKSNLLKDSSLEEMAMVDVWLDVEAHHYNPAVSPIIYQCLFVPMFGGVCDQKVVDDNLEKLKKVLDVYEARLSKCKYLAGDFVSFADVSHFPYTHYFMGTPYKSVFDSYPHVKAWWESILARPAVKKTTAGMPLPA